MPNAETTTPSRGTLPCAFQPIVAAVAAFTLIILGAATAAAENVTITDLWVSDDPYSDGQDYFDPDAPIAVFMTFESASRASSLGFAAQCSLSDAVTGEVLREVEFGPLEVDDDDYVGSYWFRMAWPEGDVEVTCAPRGNPEGALTNVVSPRSVDRGSAASLPSFDPAPLPLDRQGPDQRATPEVAQTTRRPAAEPRVVALETRRPSTRR